MKKIILILLSAVLSISLCSCGEKQEYKTTVAPSELLSAEELTPYIGYTPVMTEQISRRVCEAVFVSEPLGEYDSVTVRVYQKNQLMSQEKIKEYFDECKKMRSDAFSIESLGVEAFIAYPSIHCYIDGYHIQITAGSGGDNLQKALLMNLAKLSLENFTNLTGISAETNSQDLTEKTNS